MKEVRANFDAKIGFWVHFLYYTSVASVKLAYLVFYAELFSRTQTKRVYVLYAVSVFWACTYIAAYLLMFLYCLPFPENW
jgi:hypothetical protein